MFTACGGGSGEESEQALESEQTIELFGVIKYSRTELGTRTEFDVSNHQVDKNGQITQFDVHRTSRDAVGDDAVLVEDVESGDSTITFKYDENGNITSARTDLQDYGYQMHELTYQDGLIDTDTYSTDWSGVFDPYTLQYTYTKENGAVTAMDEECIEGKESTHQNVFEYNENGDVAKVTIAPDTDFTATVEIEYDENGNATKVTSSNKDGPFNVREFEYTSLGEVNAKASKAGFQKWQAFNTIEGALMNCY